VTTGAGDATMVQEARVKEELRKAQQAESDFYDTHKTALDGAWDAQEKRLVTMVEAVHRRQARGAPDAALAEKAAEITALRADARERKGGEGEGK